MSASSRRDADDIKSLRHGIAALTLASRQQAISSGDLATACGISRAAGYRILQTLHDEGYLLRSGSGNQVRYSPAQSVRALVAGFEAGVQALDVAIPLMIEWTKTHGWPLAIATPIGERCISRFTTDPAAARVLVRYRPGAHMIAAMSASAMVCLAWQPPAIQAAALRSQPSAAMPPYARPLAATELAAQLKSTRRNGFAVFHPIGLREASIAVPILLDNTLCAAIALRYMLVADGGKAGHAQRLRMLRALAERISSEAAAC